MVKEMKKSETISEMIIRMQKEYDFSQQSFREENGSVIDGQMPAIVLELNDRWYARMTNGGNVTYIFWDGRNNENSYIDIETEADTAEESLSCLERMCSKYKKEGYIIIDPTSFDWWC